ncbi:hypothetical protein [Litorimonas haliclonae]|uniref:hypothetical protein n=1 Tax=Litorimonas haliclonae TaxID=2081977 RepID=UPI0039F0FEDE
MVRKRQISRKSYRQKQTVLASLTLEERIRDLRAKRRETQPDKLSANEHALMRELKSLKRRVKYDELELELMNLERKIVGLKPLDRIPPDTPEMREIMKMEREMM